MNEPICQCCGKPIKGGEQAVEIRTGKLVYTVRYPKVQWKEKTFFHIGCDIAVSKGDEKCQ